MDERLKSARQQTIGRRVSLQGIGLHSGCRVSVWLKPAPVDAGIRFSVLTAGSVVEIPARIDCVRETKLATTLSRNGVAIQTVEHLLAAAAAFHIDNLTIEVDGPEIPVMDGSARPFGDAIAGAGLVVQAAPRRIMSIAACFEVSDAHGVIACSPAPRLEVCTTVAYDHPAVGRQRFEYVDAGPEAFMANLAGARTFGFLEDVERLKSRGLIKGGSLENAVVFGPEGALNDEGLRWDNEPVRHKTLDLLGDLVLIGSPIRGRFETFRAGHELHTKLVAHLRSHPELWALDVTEADYEPVTVAP